MGSAVMQAQGKWPISIGLDESDSVVSQYLGEKAFASNYLSINLELRISGLRSTACESDKLMKTVTRRMELRPSPEMPFANQGGSISILLENFGPGWASQSYSSGFIRYQDDFSDRVLTGP